MDGAGTSAGSSGWNSGGLSSGRYYSGDILYLPFSSCCKTFQNNLKAYVGDGYWTLHNDFFFFFALGLLVIFSYLSKAITFKLFMIKLVTIEFPHSVLALFFSNCTKCEWRCQIFRTTKPYINDLPNCSMSLALLVYEPFLMQPVQLLKDTFV